MNADELAAAIARHAARLCNRVRLIPGTVGPYKDCGCTRGYWQNGRQCPDCIGQGMPPGKIGTPCLVPALAHADLWRVMPRLLDNVADYAEIVGLATADGATLREVARLIRVAPCPVDAK
jgi:hypothetical protein